MKDFDYLLGFAFGFLGSVIVVLIIRAVLMAKHKDVSNKFDERQILARGLAYKCGMVTAGAYMLIVGYICTIFTPIISVFDVMLIGFWLTFTIFAVISIAKDAFFDSKEKGKVSYMVLCGFLALINIGVFVYNFIVEKEQLIIDGMLNLPIPNLACGVAFLVIIITIICKNISNKKCDEE